MKIFVNQDIKKFFLALSAVLTVFTVLAEVCVYLMCSKVSLLLLVLSIFIMGALWIVFVRYFKKQNKLMEQAVSQIHAYLDGDTDARIECDQEGELYYLFHSVNCMAEALNAHALNEVREKEFLKNTISDISHQLKTPLAALNIYNGLLRRKQKHLQP